MSRGGFTLAEVLAALLVLEVGVLGTAALVVTASRTQGAASVLERGSALVAEVADSLAEAGFTGAGERATAWGAVRWEDQGGGPLVTVRISTKDSLRGPGLEAWTAAPRAPTEAGEG